MKKGICGLLLAALLCLAALMLSGCGLTNEVLDREIRAFNACMESGDAEAFKARFLPEALTNDETYLEWFNKARTVWRPIMSDKIELRSLNVNTQRNEGHSVKTYEGLYYYDYKEDPFQVEIRYVETDGVGGLQYVSLSPVGSRDTSGDYIALGITAILIVAIILTICDIVKHKPRLYGLWIAASLLVTFRITLPSFSIGLPLGVIIYWCVRKRLLRQW